jgi:hypothetical protein
MELMAVSRVLHLKPNGYICLGTMAFSVMRRSVSTRRGLLWGVVGAKAGTLERVDDRGHVRLATPAGRLFAMPSDVGWNLDTFLFRVRSAASTRYFILLRCPIRLQKTSKRRFSVAH